MILCWSSDASSCQSTGSLGAGAGAGLRAGFSASVAPCVVAAAAGVVAAANHIIQGCLLGVRACAARVSACALLRLRCCRRGQWLLLLLEGVTAADGGCGLAGGGAVVAKANVIVVVAIGRIASECGRRVPARKHQRKPRA